MANYLTTDTELTSIANAIRIKGGTSANLTYPSEFIAAIEAIETTPDTQTKTVNPSEIQQTVEPDEGKLLSAVTVTAISSNYVGSNIAQNSVADVGVAGPTVTIPSGYYNTTVSKPIATAAFATQLTLNAGPKITLNSATGLITGTNNFSGDREPITTSGYADKHSTVKILASGSNTYQLSTASASTYTPSAATQTIPSGVYLTGAQTIEPIPIGVDNHRLILPEGLISV